jgi:hypothetical protein
MMEDQLEKRLSWKEILVALIPFLIYGPIRQIANLAVNPADRETGSLFSYGMIIGLGVMIVLVVLGCGFGWARQFPRWFYPYLSVLVMFPAAFVSDAIFSAVWNRSAETRDILQAVIWSGSLLALGGLIVLLSRWVVALHPLLISLRRDWTQLCLGIAFLAVSTFIGPVGGPFNVLVPPIFMLIAVTGSLLSTQQRTRMLWLLSGLFVVMLFRLSVHTITLPLVIAWFVLMVLPALMNLRRKPNKAIR